MVGVKCAKCGITSKENSSLTFHRFPLPSIHGPIKARVWAKYCFPNDDWTSNESLVKLYKQHKMLCGNHFDDSSFTTSAKMRLNKFAIPTEAQNILAKLRDEHPREAQKTQYQETAQMQMDMEVTASTSQCSTSIEHSSEYNLQSPDLAKNREMSQSSSNSTHSVPTNEIKVFCPKCDTEVSHTAEGIQKDETKVLIAKVYHYFEQEYEELKKMYEVIDLTPLSKFRQRTALATGVSESTVLEILQEEDRRHADEPHGQFRERDRSRKRPRQTESSSDDTDDNFEDVGQANSGQEIEVEPEAETLVVKLEPDECNDVQAQTVDPIAINVKMEPPNDEMNETNEVIATQTEPATKRKRINMLTESSDTCTQQHTQDESSSTQAPSNHRRQEELAVSSLSEQAEVKVEKDIAEEGFS